MTLGAVGVALKMLKVRSCVATRPVRANGLIALCTQEIEDGSASAVLNVNSFIDVNESAIQDAGCHSCHISITP
jgi:hypothetical protein